MTRGPKGVGAALEGPRLGELAPVGVEARTHLGGLVVGDDEVGHDDVADLHVGVQTRRDADVDERRGLEAEQAVGQLHGLLGAHATREAGHTAIAARGLDPEVVGAAVGRVGSGEPVLAVARGEGRELFGEHDEQREVGRLRVEFPGRRGQARHRRSTLSL
jgi:hypothetical protein